MRYENFKAIAAEKLELPREMVLDLPLVSITGKDELVADNFKSIREFSDSCVIIAANGMKIGIYGSGLNISYLTKETVIVRGKIDRLEFL